jgi:hypothetical protein
MAAKQEGEEEGSSKKAAKKKSLRVINCAVAQLLRKFHLIRKKAARRRNPTATSGGHGARHRHRLNGESAHRSAEDQSKIS